MPGINTSMGTSASMKGLLKTEREMLTAMEQESLSGKRINNAGDDAAGAAISDRMSATIRAHDMSIRNAADVLSMAQVAEGALDEHSAALQRIRELSIQTATDILNSEQRVYLQTEVNKLLSEMDKYPEIQLLTKLLFSMVHLLIDAFKSVLMKEKKQLSLLQI